MNCNGAMGKYFPNSKIDINSTGYLTRYPDVWIGDFNASLVPSHDDEITSKSAGSISLTAGKNHQVRLAVIIVGMPYLFTVIRMR